MKLTKSYLRQIITEMLDADGQDAGQEPSSLEDGELASQIRKQYETILQSRDFEDFFSTAENQAQILDYIEDVAKKNIVLQSLIEEYKKRAVANRSIGKQSPIKPQIEGMDGSAQANVAIIFALTTAK